jgi:hypothetical protein
MTPHQQTHQTSHFSRVAGSCQIRFVFRQSHGQAKIAWRTQANQTYSCGSGRLALNRIGGRCVRTSRTMKLYQVFDDKLRLAFAGSNNSRNNHIATAMVADTANTLRCIMGITEDRLVRAQQSGQEGSHSLASVRRPRDARDLRGVARISNCNAAEGFGRVQPSHR